MRKIVAGPIVENRDNNLLCFPLQNLFKQFDGFKEIRLIPSRPGIAFIEYTDEVAVSFAIGAVREVTC